VKDLAVGVHGDGAGAFEHALNIRAGDLPPADSNGVSYLRIPLNAL
jgi:hypothetical protein